RRARLRPGVRRLEDGAARPRQQHLSPLRRRRRLRRGRRGARGGPRRARDRADQPEGRGARIDRPPGRVDGECRSQRISDHDAVGLRFVGWAKARKRRTHHPALRAEWWARFALPTLRRRCFGKEQMNREQLAAAYTAPGRHYHNLTHIEDCLGALARVENLSALDREILSAAIWWHDVVYDATRADNEELSAQLAEQHVREDIRPESGRLGRLSRTHDVQPDDRLGAILISIDLSILGAEPARYDAYTAAIRQE